MDDDLVHKLPGAAFTIEIKHSGEILLKNCFGFSELLGENNRIESSKLWEKFVNLFDGETQSFLKDLLRSTYAKNTTIQRLALVEGKIPVEFKILFCKYQEIKPDKLCWYFYIHEFKIDDEVIKQLGMLNSKYDDLTKLPNRSLFSDRLLQAQKHAKRLKTSIAILFLDLDGFKSINDTYGHEVGDFVLKKIAERLNRFFRDSDTVARFGGDEFCAILRDLKSQNLPEGFLARLLDEISKSISYNNISFSITASIGITFFPQLDYLAPDQLIRQADKAMYKAKQSGKNQYSIFDEELDFKERQRNLLITEIKHALKNKQLDLYYLPKINLKTQKVIGVEALLRWQHPKKGLIAAADFIDKIDKSPVAINIGNWVLEEAIKKCIEFQKLNLNISVSVNVSLDHIATNNFFDRFSEILKKHELQDLSLLELEIRESGKIESFISVNERLHQLKSLGVGITFDNFGTGFLSLSYLWQMPVNRIKIDSSLVKDMLNNKTDLAIVKAAIGIGLGLERKIVASGIESQEIADALMTHGCFEGEGYAIAKPMPESDLMSWIAKKEVSQSDRVNELETNYE